VGVIGEHRARVGRKRRVENLNRTQFVRIFSLERGCGEGVGFHPFLSIYCYFRLIKQFDKDSTSRRESGKRKYMFYRTAPCFCLHARVSL